MENKYEYVKALKSITQSDVINYVCVKYIDNYNYEITRKWSKKIGECHFALTQLEAMTLEIMEVYHSNKMISLEVRYTNKHGYPCSILKFE